MSNEAKTTANTKTETPQTPFQIPAAFDPMQFWTQGQAQMLKMMTDATARWQSFGDQYAAIEQQVASHATKAVNDWAQLAKDAIAYGVQLSSEARKLSVETAKKMGVNA